MKRVTVLSIDFDFFQKVDKDTLVTCYPDGVDVSTQLSKFTWAGYYVNLNTAKKLADVKVDEDKLNQMKDIISKCENVEFVKVANSHFHIYSFIQDLMSEYKSSFLDVINVDMHHDLMNKNINVDCGNWLGRIAEEYDTRIKWIANPISKEMFGLTDDRFSMISTDLGIINPKKIDAIFLCRSDNWTPPHLDKDFDSLYQHITDTFVGCSNADVRAEQGIMKPRDMTDELKMAEEIEKFKINGKPN